MIGKVRNTKKLQKKNLYVLRLQSKFFLTVVFILIFLLILFRLAMFLTDSNNIKEVLFFPAMKPDDNKSKDDANEEGDNKEKK